MTRLNSLSGRWTQFGEMVDDHQKALPSEQVAQEFGRNLFGPSHQLHLFADSLQQGMLASLDLQGQIMFYQNREQGVSG